MDLRHTYVARLGVPIPIELPHSFKLDYQKQPISHTARFFYKYGTNPTHFDELVSSIKYSILHWTRLKGTVWFLGAAQEKSHSYVFLVPHKKRSFKYAILVPHKKRSLSITFSYRTRKYWDLSTTTYLQALQSDSQLHQLNLIEKKISRPQFEAS